MYATFLKMSQAICINFLKSKSQYSDILSAGKKMFFFLHINDELIKFLGTDLIKHIQSK